MSTISMCPKCHQLVTIPEGVAAESAVRCPVCQAEYPLSVALRAVPPTLIPVEQQAPLGSPAETVLTARAAGEAAATPAESQAASAAPALQPWERLDAAAEADLGPGEHEHLAVKADEETVDAALFGGFPSKAAGLGEQRKQTAPSAEIAAAPVPAKRRPRSRAETSPLRKLLGVVGGGVLGLTIGYYLLNWIGGSQFDFAKIYLPGVPHTYKHWSHSAGSRTGPHQTEPHKPR